MKITDLRCGRVFEGDFVDKIPGGTAPTDDQLETYLGITPEHKDYRNYKRPNQHKTAVLRRTDGKGYYVIPVNDKFYKVEA